MDDWEHPTWTVISLGVLPVFYNAWMMVLCAMDIFVTIAIYKIAWQMFNTKDFGFLNQYFDSENTHDINEYVNH